MTALWNAWTWLPMWAQVLLTVSLWFGTCECIALVCSANSRADEVMERDRERAAQREALARPLPQRPYQPFRTVR